VTTPEGKKEQVRLIGIDAPEISVNMKAQSDAKRMGQDLEIVIMMGREAMEFVKSLYIGSNSIKLVFDVQERDKYGRLLAYAYQGTCFAAKKGYASCKMLPNKDYHYVILEDEIKQQIFINATIIKAGYASPMTIPPNVKHADLFQELYEEARENKRGLWNEKARKIPTEIENNDLNAKASSIKDKETCEALEGNWSRRGLGGLLSCSLPTSDAGKVCRNSFECQSYCIADERWANEGKCYHETATVGRCLYYVNKGIVSSVCTD